MSKLSAVADGNGDFIVPQLNANYKEKHPDCDPENIVTLEISATTQVAFASAQNAVPVLRKICIMNNGSEPLENIEVRLSAQPSFCHDQSWAVDVIDAGCDVCLSDMDITLDLGMLSGLDEAEHGQRFFAGVSCRVMRLFAARVAPHNVYTRRVAPCVCTAQHLNM